jgi:serine/threonine protein kinase
MYDSDGTVTMIDFGIARFTNSQRGNIMGTPGYAPPEQYRGDISPSADIYALGATMHHLLSGRDPRGQKPFTYTAIRDLVPTVSPTTAAILSTALQLSPNDRFASILEMRESIRTVLRGEETIQFAILGSTSPIPTVNQALPPTPAQAPASAPLFLPTEDELNAAADHGHHATPALPLVNNDTDDISTAYITTVITDDADTPPETNELDFAFAHHVESATADVDTTSERALTMEHKAIIVEPKTRWRVFVFVVAVILCIGMLVLSNGGTNWQPWQANAQTITVVLEVDVPNDATLDASFQSALDAYLADTYGSQWAQIGTPTFLGTPPEQLSANADGSSHYRGRLKVTLTRLP